MICLTIKLMLFSLFSNIELKHHSEYELRFIDEINLVRTNPKSYAKYVYDYAIKYGTNAEKEAAQEAIKVLEEMSPLQKLKPSEILRYQVEKYEAIDTSNQWVNHSGFRWIEVGYKSGGENIIMSCKNTYQNMVIRLLIDADIPNRGHRKNILSKNYNVIAVKRVVFGDESKPFQCRIWWIQEFFNLDK